ncbi:MAG: hypothetical protein CUN55_00570 [Phototrophicales bacterium]|nr:MAG: hypothetical protein CUN55_00570 [Phototrophicales bacterium]
MRQGRFKQNINKAIDERITAHSVIEIDIATVASVVSNTVAMISLKGVSGVHRASVPKTMDIAVGDSVVVIRPTSTNRWSVIAPFADSFAGQSQRPIQIRADSVITKKLKSVVDILGDEKLVEVASASATIDSNNVLIDTENQAATDDLEWIVGMKTGQVSYLRPVSISRVVTLKHGVGNIYSPNGSDIVVDDDYLVVRLQALANGNVAMTGMKQTIDHGSLSGLSDDDHPQYLLIDGTRDMTGSLQIRTTSDTDAIDVIATNTAINADFMAHSNTPADGVSLRTWHRGGTESSPTPTGSLWVLGSFVGYGRDSSNTDAAGAKVEIASQNAWTLTDHSSYVTIWAIPPNDTNLQAVAQFFGNSILLNQPVTITLPSGSVESRQHSASDSYSVIAQHVNSSGAAWHGGFFIGRRARWNGTSEQAVQAGDRLAFFRGDGWDTSWYQTGGGIDIYADGTWTTTSHPSYVEIKAVKSGSTADNAVVRVRGDRAEFLQHADHNYIDHGEILPRLTTTQRDAISSPTNGEILYNTTTNRFTVRENGIWVEISSGGGSGFTFSGASVYNSANISIPKNADTLITFDSEEYDTDSYHSTATNTGRLTVPSTAKYIVHASVSLDGNNQDIIKIKFRKNGTTIVSEFFLDIPGLDGETFFLTDILDLAANDYLELLVFHSAGASRNVLATTNISPYFKIARLA